MIHIVAITFKYRLQGKSILPLCKATGTDRLFSESWFPLIHGNYSPLFRECFIPHAALGLWRQGFSFPARLSQVSSLFQLAASTVNVMEKLSWWVTWILNKGMMWTRGHTFLLVLLWRNLRSREWLAPHFFERSGSAKTILLIFLTNNECREIILFSTYMSKSWANIERECHLIPCLLRYTIGIILYYPILFSI